MGAGGTQLVAVVAMAENFVIGDGTGLPWRLPDDLRRFKAITLGRPVVMGRRTFETLLRPLPGRHNIVLTRDRGWAGRGVTAAHSLEQALAAAGDVPEVMIIGGAQLYGQCWPRIARIEMTLVHAQAAGDVRLAGFDWRDWIVQAAERHPADERHAHDFSFMTLLRKLQA